MTKVWPESSGFPGNLVLFMSASLDVSLVHNGMGAVAAKLTNVNERKIGYLSDRYHVDEMVKMRT